MDPIAPQTEECVLPVAPPAVVPPPCYFWNVCSARAALEKAGRAVCRRCAAHLRGIEYPLRGASIEPIYLTERAAAEALDMVPSTMGTASPGGPSDDSEVN